METGNDMTPWGEDNAQPPSPVLPPYEYSAPRPISPPPPSPAHATRVMPPPPTYTPVMPPQKSGWGTGRILAVIAFCLLCAVGLFVAAGVAFFSFGQSSVNSSVPRDAYIGDCFSRTNATMEPVSCDQPHHYEVYSYIILQGDSYPSRLERIGGAQVCEEDFEWYTGENYWRSSLDYSIPYPTEDEWNAGERETVCVLHDAEFDVLTGSKAVDG